MRTLGRTGLKVSMIGLGGDHVGKPEKEEDSIAIIHRALELGVTFFDNADCYNKGVSEERMGKALEGHRKMIVLMTKVDQRDAKGSRETLERSLRRLRTDYLDIWQFHGVPTLAQLDKILGPGGAMETAEQARKEGKVRFIGLTGHFDPAVHLEAIKRYPFDTIQMPINVMDVHYKSFRKTVLDEAVTRNVGIIAMKSMGFGTILNHKVATAAEALRWVWSQPIGVLVSGFDRLEVADYNIYQAKTFTPMPEAEQEVLLARTKSFPSAVIEFYKSLG
jgi:aryl-alcohol dehydrogenase-like predicted oxidoreductase